MNPFVVEAKRILGPALAAASKSTMQAPFGRASARAPSGHVLAVLAAFAGGAALMVALAPEGRARVGDAFRRLMKRTPQQSGGATQADAADEQPSGAME